MHAYCCVFLSPICCCCALVRLVSVDLLLGRFGVEAMLCCVSALGFLWVSWVVIAGYGLWGAGMAFRVFSGLGYSFWIVGWLLMMGCLLR